MTRQFELGQEVAANIGAFPIMGWVTATGKQCCCVRTVSDRYTWVPNTKLTAVRRNWLGTVTSGEERDR